MPNSTESPAPLANEQYKLAGGLDTPNAKMSLEHDYFNSGAAEVHFRTGQIIPSPIPSNQYGCSDRTHFASALTRERNGHPRVVTSPNIRDGLGRTLYHVAGMAGKVLEFCRDTAFRGFFAGGGTGYELKGAATTQSKATGEQSVWHQVEEKDLTFWRDSEVVGTPVPGRFPEEDFIPDYMSQDHSSPIQVRAAKRVQREKGAEPGIGENWMIVGERTTPSTSRGSSPSRLSTRKTPTSIASSNRRTAPRLGRRPILPASRPSLTSYAGSPGMRLDRPASYASPRSPTAFAGGVATASHVSPKHETSSPVSVEVQKHAARIRRRELEEEKNLSRFNQQLKAMIKEGKEALGTRIEVEDEIG